MKRPKLTDIPTDEQILVAKGTTTHSVDAIKEYALKMLCDYSTSGTAEQILVELGLAKIKFDRSNRRSVVPTSLCKMAVWHWHVTKQIPRGVDYL